MMAPAMRFVLRASYKARSSIVGPRPTFTTTADGRIVENASALTIPVVSAVSGTETTKKSADGQKSRRLSSGNQRSTVDEAATVLRLATYTFISNAFARAAI